MFQTDQASAVPALPAPAAASVQGFFSNGNPGTGLAATVVDADFLNMMMMELTNVVKATGLTPSKTVYNQLLQSILILIGAGTTNYGVDAGIVNGYQATFAATVLAAADGVVLNFKAAHGNTGASTFTPNPGVIAPAPIWGGNNLALTGGEILPGFTSVQYSAAFGAWILLFNAGGAIQLAAGSYIPDAPALDRSAKVASTRWTLRNVFRVGEVKMYHGSVASIASVWGPGWQLADGTNGTANLKDQFIVGAGATYAPGATGGAVNATLSVANLPPHNHVINIGDPGHAHGVADPGHNHGLPQTPHGHGINDPGHAHGLQNLGSAQAGGDNGGAPVSASTGFSTGRGLAGTFASGTGVSIQAQFANIGINAAVTGIGIFASGTGIFANSNNTGSGTAFNKLPPYFALCFIEYTGIGA